MRRARIKALAAVPVRKKTVQDTVVTPDESNVPDEEQKKKDVSNTEKQEQDVRDVAEIKKKEDKFSTDKLDGESVKNIENVKEKIIEEKDGEDNLMKPEAAVTEKINSEKFCSPVKATFQEPCSQLSNRSEKITNQLAQKNVSPPDVPTIDIASPTKLTQSRSCFMRPTPRLDSSGRIRKNSIQGSGASASESEDEHGKRAASVVSNRVRNDSVCSVQSNKESAINDNQNNSPRIKTTQKRRMLISESARRLAEARREFLLKHENKTPDRAKLKMYDLIYYNPVTNPMKKSTIQRQEITPQQIEMEEENEDDPSAIPAPQVKVGPDGQLIIDEQSLVIEQTGAKRGREILASEAIIEDDNNRSGGFYKKHKRSKDWPNWETYKFYKVLNVVGPDFLLMQTLFPNRTRQEIKQKYKKEERVNHKLVEKALKYHQEFDTKMLEQELELLKSLENIENHKLPKKAPEKTNDGQPVTKKAKRLKRRLVAGSIGECESSSLNDPELEDATVSLMGDEVDTATTEETNIDETSNVQRQQARKESSKARKLKRRADDRSDKSDNNSSYASSNADSESDPEVYQIRPTRSGRQPKVKKLRAPDVNMLDKSVENTVSLNSETATSLEVTEEASTPAEDGGNAETPDSMALPNISQMEPGSLVIVSKESEDDPEDTILQVYMVGPNVDNGCAAIKPNLMPVDMPPKLLTTATNESLSEDVESISMDNCKN